MRLALPNRLWFVLLPMMVLVCTMSTWSLASAEEITDIINVPDSVPDAKTARETAAELLTLGFGILGGIALIIVALQGVRYSLSSGDPAKTTQARNGIIYAGVGVVVATVGTSLTRFVLTEVIPTADDRGALVGGSSVFVNAAGFIALITGIISVIMIIVGGYKFTLSDGDATKAASARTTIIYALIGAAISGLAAPILINILNRFT